MSYKRQNKKHSSEQRVGRLERVSSSNYFSLKQVEKNQKEIAKRLNEGLFPESTFLQRIKWLFFGTPFNKIELDVKETSLEEMANKLQKSTENE